MLTINRIEAGDAPVYHHEGGSDSSASSSSGDESFGRKLYKHLMNGVSNMLPFTVAGGLSMAFGCTLRAPHGGIFVFPVVGNPIMYVVALAVGSVIGMLLLGLFKKKVTE